MRFGFRIERAGEGVLLARGALTCVAIGLDWRARTNPADLAALFERERTMVTMRSDAKPEGAARKERGSPIAAWWLSACTLMGP